MTLAADLRISSPEMPFCDVAAAAPTAILELVGDEQPSTGPAAIFLQVTGSEADLSAVETALDRSTAIESIDPIAEGRETTLYRLTSTIRRPTSLDRITDGRMFPERVWITPKGWRVHQQFADREQVRSYRALCEELGVSLVLDRLYDPAEREVKRVGLTAKQREAVLTAYELGYYAVPRRVSMADVAAPLDISIQSLSERLMRAEAHLVDHYVSVLEYGNSPPNTLGQL